MAVSAQMKSTAFATQWSSHLPPPEDMNPWSIKHIEHLHLQVSHSSSVSHIHFSPLSAVCYLSELRSTTKIHLSIATPSLAFDFLSIKGAWISALLFICSSVLSIYQQALCWVAMASATH